LDKLLKKQRNSLSSTDLLSMIQDTASGMYYLQQQDIVHRDLSCENLLVERRSTKYQVKVADLGFSRQLKSEEFYESKDSNIPVRWSPPEVLQAGNYSTKSDVWSFGIVMWEIYSFGSIPYAGMSNTDVIEFVLRGNRLDFPSNSSPQHNSLIVIFLSCCEQESRNRPDFKAVYDQIDKLNRTK